MYIRANKFCVFVSSSNLENNHFSGYIPKQFEFIPQLRYLYLFVCIILPFFFFSFVKALQFNTLSCSPFWLFRIDGNLFQQSINGSTHSPSSSTDNNVSHSPRASQVSFSYPSKTVHNKHRKKVGIAVMVGVVGSLFVIAVISAIIFIINARRYHKNNPYWFKSSSESLCSLPITAPAGNVNLKNTYDVDSNVSC